MSLIPPSFEFKGDKQKAISFKAYALQFYKSVISQVEEGGVDFSHKTKQLPDGTVISLVTTKEDIYNHRRGHIVITSPYEPEEIDTMTIYLESGYYDLYSSEVCTERFYHPAILEYNSVISSYIYSTPTPIQGNLKITSDYTGEQLPNLFTSESIPCTPLVPSVKDSCGHFYTGGSYFSVDDHAGMSKMCQWRMPSSMFSGKLRLFVQSLYGSRRDDYYCEWYSTSFDYTLKVNGVSLSPNFVDNTWLITTPEYEYYLAIYKKKYIILYHLLPSAAGIRLRELLIQDESTLSKDIIKKIEAYILSTCVLETESPKYIGISGSDVKGLPVAYGFHFKNSGLQGDMISLEENYPRDCYNTYHYTLNIKHTKTPDTDLFSAEIKVTAGPSEWWPMYMSITLIKPFYLKVGLPTGMYPVPGVGLGRQDDNNGYRTDVYLCYDKDDKIHKFGLEYNITPISSGITHTEIRKAPLVNGDPSEVVDYVGTTGSGGYAGYLKVLKDGNTLITQSPESYQSKTTKKYTKYTLSSQKTVTGYAGWTYTSTYDSETLLNPVDFMMINGYWSNSSGGSVNNIPGVSFDSYYFIHDNYTLLYEVDGLTVGQEDAAVFVEIPFQDCEQVWLGGTVNRPAQNSSWSKRSSIGSSEYPCEWRIYGSTAYILPGGKYRIVSKGMIDKRYFSYQGYTDVGTGDLIGSGTDSVLQRGEITILEGMSEKPAFIDNEQGSTNWHFKVNPLTDGPIGLEDWRSNTTGEYYKYSMGFKTKNDDDFPADSSVGWA